MPGPASDSSQSGFRGGVRQGQHSGDEQCDAKRIIRARDALASGDDPGAKVWLTQMLAGDPQNLEALQRLGDVLEREGRLQEALDAYDRACTVYRRTSPVQAEGAVMFIRRADLAEKLGLDRCSARGSGRRVPLQG